MLARGRYRDEIERTCTESVCGAREGTNRADLHGIAGEVGVEGLISRRADLLLGTPLEKLKHRIAGDLVGKSRAAGARDAALTVEEDLCADVHRLVEEALLAIEPRLRASDRHRLILEGAFAALVADRAVERVVEEEEFKHALLRLAGDGRRHLRADVHAIGDDLGTGRRRLRDALDLDEAGPAGGHWLKERVIAEPGDFDAEEFSGTNGQRALRDLNGHAIDGDAHHLNSRNIGAGIARDCHRAAPAKR